MQEYQNDFVFYLLGAKQAGECCASSSLRRAIVLAPEGGVGVSDEWHLVFMNGIAKKASLA